MSNKVIGLTYQATSPTRPAHRRPIKDIVGDKNSLGILMMCEEWLEECRKLSGAPSVYKDEYAVWYSAEVLEARIGVNTLSIIRPYSFYNTNQSVGGASVDIEPEDFALLTEIYNGLTDEYIETVEHTEAAMNYKSAIERSVIVKYAMNHYGNDIEQFREVATKEFNESIATYKADLHKAIESEDGNKEASDALIALEEELTPENIEKEIYSDMQMLAVDKLIEEGMIIKSAEKLTEDEIKDVEENNKLVYFWTNSHLNNFHAHPTGVNSFSGSIGGNVGDLDSNFLETWDDESGSYLPSTSEASSQGIVYPFTSEFLDHPMPICAGVIQQVNGKSKMVFNELRRWQSVEFGDYTYARTPLLTYIKGLEEKAPEQTFMQSLLGKVVEDVKHPDEYIEYMNPTVSEYTNELFTIFLDNPVEVLYDIDEARLTTFVTTSHNDLTYPKKYFKSKKQATAWLTQIGNTNKKINKLSVTKINKLIDKVLLDTFFNPKADCSSEMDLMHRVLTMYGKDIFALATEFKGLGGGARRDEIVKTIRGFISLNDVPLYQFNKMKELGFELDDVLQMTKEDINEKVRESYYSSHTNSTTTTTTTTSTSTKNNWPMCAKTMLYHITTTFGKTIYASATIYAKKLKFQEGFETYLNIPKEDAKNFWENAEMLDYNVMDLLTDQNTIQMTMYDVEAITKWPLTPINTKRLLASYPLLDILYLDRPYLELLLLESRLKDNVIYVGNVLTHQTMASWLTNMGVNIIGSFGVHHIDNVGPVREMFRELVNEILEIPEDKKELFWEYVKDMKLDVMSAIEDKDTESVNKLVNMTDAEISEVRKLTKHSDNIYALVNYETQPVSNNTAYTFDELKVTLKSNATFEQKKDLLEEFGIKKYITMMVGEIYEVDFNAVNIDKAYTELFVLYLPTEYTLEECIKAINNANKIELDLEEFLSLSAAEADRYSKKLIEFNPESVDFLYMKSKNLSWTEILDGDRNKPKVCLPTLSNKVYYKCENDVLIPITKEKYEELCRKLCVIESMTAGKTVTLYFTSGLSLNLGEGVKMSDFRLGEVVYPTN